MIRKEITADVALRKLQALCARAEHSEGEMRQKMRGWGLDEETQSSIMRKLTEQGFVDDERFCRMYIDDKLKFGRCGRKKIEQGLLLKGIDKKIYQPMLSEIDTDTLAETLQHLLEAKRRTVKAASPYEMRMKLIRYAMSRGFEMREINICLDEMNISDDI